MRVAIVWMFSLFCLCAGAVPATWDGVRMYRGDVVTPDGGIYEDKKIYDTTGYLYSSEGVATLHGMLYAHWEEDVLFLRQYDYTASTKPVQNSWILAYYGQILGAETISEATFVELGADWVGGTRVIDSSDFYLGFTTSVRGVEDGTTWYGWAHVAIDESKDIHVLGSGINLWGGPVTVGVEPTPEPSSMVLVLLGLGALGLKHRPHAFSTVLTDHNSRI